MKGIAQNAELLELIDQRRDEWIERNFRIVDKGGHLVPLTLNPVQRSYWEGRSLRDRLLKPRQAGVSSVVLADLLSEAMLFHGLNMLYMVQKPEDQNIAIHRDRAQLYYDATAPEWRPPLAISNTHQMSFEFPGGRRSTLFFTGSGGQGIGRGITLHRGARDEIRDWEPHEGSASDSSLLGLPQDSRVIDMSTASFYGSPWHTLCQKAKGGSDGFGYRFFRWFDLPEYRLPGDGTLFDLDEGEAQLRESYHLSDEQLRWRRAMLLRAGGDLREFWQEYPEDDLRCWMLAGTGAMPQDILDRMLTLVRPPRPLPKDSPLQGFGDLLHVWLPPEPGDSYVIMADPAEGLPNSHDSAAVVRRMRGWAHAASLRGKIAPGELGGMLVSLGRAYTPALVGWERNYQGAGVQERVVEQLRYPHVYRWRSRVQPGADDRYGFVTSLQSKADLVGKMQEAMRTSFWSSPDGELIDQYMRLQSQGNDRYDTSTLDLAMADMLCLEARSQAQGMEYLGRRSGGNDQRWRIPRYLRQERRENAYPHQGKQPSRQGF